MAAPATDAQGPVADARFDGVKKDEDRDEDDEYSPFYGIDKGAVLQEARVFHDPQFDARKCQQVITKLLYLINQGETFTKTEATEVFFAVTKLFQSKDSNLRRMVYLIIKEICPSSDEVIIVTSSLMKDMNSKVDLYRANAIRVLCKITDASLLQQIERYLKQAVVDKNAVVASAALASGVQLMQLSSDIVKRWSSEVQEAVHSKQPLVQFHGLMLLHQIRQNDRLAVSKLVTTLTRGTIRSPLAQCLLIRYVSQVIAESNAPAGGERPFYEFLESCLHHKSEMVIFEAARAIAGLNDVTTRELTPAITKLQLFLSSSKPVLRFAAVRTLNKVAMTHALAVTNCNIDMESLISDQNRSIATLAITTLLKTGNESSVDRLMKQITSFMSDIQDEFKIVVVSAIRSMCIKFPSKYRVLMNFLSNILREEGGFEYKKAIVESILILIHEIPDAKESGLSHLCEFIEDCEFTFLSTQILHLLGEEGPRAADPAKYLRYIFNRVILENATVRASAVSALAKFGAACDFLRPRINTLLSFCLHDNDDEVRDRATFYLSVLGSQDSESPSDVLTQTLDVNLLALEASLSSYVATPSDKPFDLSAIPKDVPRAPKAAAAPGQLGGGAGGAKGGAAAAPVPPPSESAYAAELAAIPAFAGLGKLFKSSEPFELTESETEYKIVAIKHSFPEHIVFQFNCENTIPEQVLENVSILMEPEDDQFEEECTVPLEVMPCGETGHTYVCMRRPGGALLQGKFVNTLKFTVKEVDPSTGEPEEDGYDDEYQLEDLEVGSQDYVQKAAVGNFRNTWDSLDEESERVDDYGLGTRESLQDAVEAVMAILGMQPCEGSEAVPPNARSHTTLLSGMFVGYTQVLVRLSFGMDSGSNVAMKLAVRSENPDTSELVHQIIANA